MSRKPFCAVCKREVDEVIFSHHTATGKTWVEAKCHGEVETVEMEDNGSVFLGLGSIEMGVAFWKPKLIAGGK